MIYRGRFAPTPSGPLHAGSLLTALASYLQARAVAGQWLLRIDDLDRARCRPEHTDTILRQLEAHGLYWDAAPRLQSQHVDEYAAAYEQLLAQGLVYGCACARAQLAQTSRSGVDGPVYAGTCRDQAKDLRSAAVRLRVAAIELQIDDACQGRLRRQLERDVGDFIVRRADGQIAYQLACVIDEQQQGITEVVRGADLIGSSFKQRYLRQLLDLAQPAYLHIPVLVDAQGQKLSKQNHAASIDAYSVVDNLFACLSRLGQQPPASLRQAGAAEILQWATVGWTLRQVPQLTRLPAPADVGAW
ncbi:MAG: glutamyl-Q tRNA(Asp) ligase [Nevskia sp.]|nr:glutamyl-Q tRNA(Asp) ligase [Nevskia sp.]